MQELFITYSKTFALALLLDMIEFLVIAQDTTLFEFMLKTSIDFQLNNLGRLTSIILRHGSIRRLLLHLLFVFLLLLLLWHLLLLLLLLLVRADALLALTSRPCMHCLSTLMLLHN